MFDSITVPTWIHIWAKAMLISSQKRTNVKWKYPILSLSNLFVRFMSVNFHQPVCLQKIQLCVRNSPVIFPLLITGGLGPPCTTSIFWELTNLAFWRSWSSRWCIVLFHELNPVDIDTFVSHWRRCSCNLLRKLGRRNKSLKFLPIQSNIQILPKSLYCIRIACLAE